MDTYPRPSMDSHDTQVAITKVALIWIVGLVGKAIPNTLGEWVLLATLIYTVAQTYFLFRDKWHARRDKK